MAPTLGAVALTDEGGSAIELSGNSADKSRVDIPHLRDDCYCSWFTVDCQGQCRGRARARITTLPRVPSLGRLNSRIEVTGNVLTLAIV